jgi:hypothetical protein
VEAIDLPPPDVELADVRVDAGDVRRRAEQDELAPSDESVEEIVRYLIYLGAAYLEAERVIEGAGSIEDAYAELHRRFGRAGGADAVVRFHYGEAARNYAAETRAGAAHDRLSGAYELVAEKLAAEIRIRRERIANLKRALRR